MIEKRSEKDRVAHFAWTDEDVPFLEVTRAKVEKHGKSWVVLSGDGVVMSTHKSEPEANAALKGG